VVLLLSAFAQRVPAAPAILERSPA
jgi:hypothetical protein